MVHNLAVKYSIIITNELNNTEKQKVIAYGLEVIIGAIIKIIVFTTLPLALGIFPQTIAAMITGGFFRLSAGGAHCTAFYRCLLSSVAVFLTMGFMSRYFATVLPVMVIAYLTAFIAIIIAYFKSPAETSAKPIRNKTHRRNLKIISVLTPIIYLVAINLIPLNKGLILASSMGLLFQAYTVTPSGYRFMHKMDQLIIRTRDFVQLNHKGGERSET